MLDIQREMLDDVKRRAATSGITNIRSTQADASKLPYREEVFDGAYLITVLGEIPDQDATLRDLRRVLKPNARLVIGELLFDPDFCSLRVLRDRAERAGFTFRDKVGSAAGYLARFERC